MSVLPRAKVNFGALLVAGRNRAIAAPANPATTAQPQYRRMSLFSIECQWFLLAGGMLSLILEYTGFGPALPFLWPAAVLGLLYSYGKVYESV